MSVVCDGCVLCARDVLLLCVACLGLFVCCFRFRVVLLCDVCVYVCLVVD